MATTLPSGSAGGSIFWENLSCESLEDADFSTLIAEHPTSPFYVPPLPRPTSSSSSRIPPPTHINLPPTRRMSIAPSDKRFSSPSSPKLSGWNFLKRNAGPQSLQVSIPQSTSKPRSGGAQAIGNGFPSASPNSATKRPGNSRSTTWTDNLPTTRALTLDQPTPPAPPPASSLTSQPLQPLQERPQVHPQPYYPPSRHTAAPQPTYPTPPIVVVPSVLNQPRGRFGLFRRASMSPKVEKGGFFGFVGSPGDVSGAGDKDKKRLKGLGLKKQKRLSMGGATGSGPPSSPNANEVFLSPPQPLFSPASQQQRFPSSSSSTGSSGFQRPSSPLSPYYTPPEHPSYRRTTYHPSSSSPVHSPSPTLYNQPPPSSPSPAPFSALTPPSSPRASQRIIAGGAGRPSLDFHPGRPHVAFPYHAPPSSSSLCSASADDEDDEEEDFPFRDARPNKASKRKIRPKSQHSQQRGRSCSPLRTGAGVGVGGDLEGAKVTRAWWKVASGGSGLAESPSHQSVQERANRGAGMLGSSAPTVRGSMEAAVGWGSRRGSTSTKEEGEGGAPRVVERGFKVTSRPSSPASSFRRGPHPAAGGGSSLRPEGESGSGRSSLALGRTEGEGGRGGVASTRELTNTSSPSTANSTTSHPSPVLTPRISSNPVSRSNSLLASPGLQRPRNPSRSSSINRSWTPPSKSAPPPPSAPSSVPTTPHLATSFPPPPPPQQQPTLPLLPLGQPQPDDLNLKLELEDAAPSSPLFFAQSSRISPTLSNSSRSQENSSSSNGSNEASVGFTQNGTDHETEPTDDGEELGTSCEGGERDGWEERRWSLNSEVVGGTEGKVRC